MKSKLLLFVYGLMLVFICAPQKRGIEVNAQSVKDYLLTLQKSNKAFGPDSFEYTDVAWTYPAVHALTLLDAKIPRADSCYKNGHKSWMEKASWKNGPWYWSLYQKANLYNLYNKKGDLEPGMTPGMELKLQHEPRSNYTEFRDYVDGKFYDISSLWYVVNAVHILDGKITNKDYVKKFVLSRLAEQGGFEDMLGDRSRPSRNKAHVIVTYNAVMTLRALKIPIPEEQKIISWVQSLQTADGGFRWNPASESSSNKADVWYTWVALKTLKTLGAKPERVDDCLRWLNALQNADGGFGDRPGWRSRIYSTYYAIHAIDILAGNTIRGINPKTRTQKNKIIPEGKYSIYQAYHKSPEGGSEMVEIVSDMGFNLIAVKTEEDTLYKRQSGGISNSVKEARAYAQKQNYDLEIVEAPENYRHRLKWFSGMNGNHVSNFMIPPDITKQQWTTIKEAYKAGTKRLEWKKYKAQVIGPILEMGNLFYPELDYTRINAYMVYDEGLHGKTGYNAVPAAHFGNYDWVRHFPYKERWVGQLPMIADGDAHGDINEWKENLQSFRNVFIARDYSYDDYIDASQNNRSVCVIKMPSGDIRYYGSQAAVDYLKKHRKEWQWW